MDQKTPDFRQPEIILTADHQVACDGGGGPAGHPRVYMTLDNQRGYADCSYCDRRFVKTGHDNAHNSQPDDHPLITH